MFNFKGVKNLKKHQFIQLLFVEITSFSDLPRLDLTPQDWICKIKRRDIMLKLL